MPTTLVTILTGGTANNVSSERATGDDRRTRAGLVFLVAGTLLLVWAWASWIFRTSDSSGEQDARVSVVVRADGTEAQGAGAGSSAVRDSTAPSVCAGTAATDRLGLVAVVVVASLRV